MTQLLLDTHALLWWLAEPDRLSPAAHAAISDPANSVYVSAASGWEIATKVRLARLTLVTVDPALQAFPCRLLW